MLSLHFSFRGQYFLIRELLAALVQKCEGGEKTKTYNS